MINVDSDSHLEMEGGAICERRKQTDRWSRGPQSRTAPLAEVARGRCPLPKKILYSLEVISSALFGQNN